MNGLVTDASGQDLPGANVIAVHEPSGTQYGVATRSGGVYNIPTMRIGGPYSITVSFIGYVSQIESDVYLSLGQNLRLDFVNVETPQLLINVFQFQIYFAYVSAQ